MPFEAPHAIDMALMASHLYLALRFFLQSVSVTDTVDYSEMITDILKYFSTSLRSAIRSSRYHHFPHRSVVDMSAEHRVHTGDCWQRTKSVRSLSAYRRQRIHSSTGHRGLITGLLYGHAI